MKTRTLLASPALLAIPLLCTGCGGGEADPREVHAREVQEELKDALRTLRGYAHDRSDELVAQVNGRLQGLEQRLEELRARAGAAAAEERRELEATLQQVEEKRERLRQRLDELQGAGASAWAELRDGVLSALEELDSSLDQAHRDFRTKASR